MTRAEALQFFELLPANTDVHTMTDEAAARIAVESTLSTIKGRYKKLALKYHPDKNKTNSSYDPKNFLKVSEAFDVLEACFDVNIAIASIDHNRESIWAEFQRQEQAAQNSFWDNGGWKEAPSTNDGMTVEIDLRRDIFIIIENVIAVFINANSGQAPDSMLGVCTWEALSSMPYFVAALSMQDAMGDTPLHKLAKAMSQGSNRYVDALF